MGSLRVPDLLQKCRQTIGAVPYHDRIDPAWNGVHPASLVTLDASGFPSARTIVPREIAEDLSYFRLQTRAETLKLEEIVNNPRVSLAYQDQRGRQGWLTVKGMATLDSAGRGRSGRSAGPDQVNIHVEVTEIRGMSYLVDLMGDKDGWVPITLVRDSDKRDWQSVL